MTSHDLLSLKTGVNVPAISNKQKNLEENLFFVGILKAFLRKEQDPEPGPDLDPYFCVRIRGSGSVSNPHGSATHLFDTFFQCCGSALVSMWIWIQHFRSMLIRIQRFNDHKIKFYFLKKFIFFIKLIYFEYL